MAMAAALSRQTAFIRAPRDTMEGMTIARRLAADKRQSIVAPQWKPIVTALFARRLRAGALRRIARPGCNAIGTLQPKTPDSFYFICLH
jgi:hypothetical protein